jgi:XTP/dITP diphosphohydrolase
VFGDAVADTPDAVVAQWERVKAVEKAHRSSVMDGIPMAMPALALADKMVGRAAKVGVARDAVAIPATEDELGAQLLGMVTAARAAGLDSERALRTALRGLSDEVRAREAAS